MTSWCLEAAGTAPSWLAIEDISRPAGFAVVGVRGMIGPTRARPRCLGVSPEIGSIHRSRLATWSMRLPCIGIGDNATQSDRSIEAADSTPSGPPSSIRMRRWLTGVGQPAQGPLCSPAPSSSRGNDDRTASIVNTGATVDHDCRSGLRAQSLRARLCGDVEIGDVTFVGAGATLTPGVTVGNGATIGAGAVVLAALPTVHAVAGVPARPVGEPMSERIYLSPPYLSGPKDARVDEAIASNWIAPLGPQVEAFEDELAQQVGVSRALATATGTAAIHLALDVLGVANRAMW